MPVMQQAPSVVSLDPKSPSHSSHIVGPQQLPAPTPTMMSVQPPTFQNGYPPRMVTSPQPPFNQIPSQLPNMTPQQFPQATSPNTLKNHSLQHNHQINLTSAITGSSQRVLPSRLYEHPLKVQHQKYIQQSAHINAL